MRKIIVAIMLLAGWALMGSWGIMAHADDLTMGGNDGNQVINDEGYGNDDTEYYGSPDDTANDMVNDDASSVDTVNSDGSPQENPPANQP